MNPGDLGRRFCYVLAACLMLTLAGYAAAGPAEDTARYMKMLNSDSVKVRTDAAKYISRSSLTDPALFETVKTKLLSGFLENQHNRNHMDEMAWYCKALSVSGNQDYIEVLDQVARDTTNVNLKRHCRNSIERLSVRAAQKTAVQEGLAKDNTLSADENKMIAMLRSQNPLVMRDAAKQIYRHPFMGDAVTDVMGEELLRACPNTSGNRNMIDALAWMCKALGASGKAKYRETLMKVIETGTSDKLKKFAGKSLSML